MAKGAILLTEGPWQRENYEIFARFAEAAVGVSAGIDENVKRRGMTGRHEGQATIICYGRLVDLILENKVTNFV